MADIATFPILRHLRAAPTAHVLHYHKGRLVGAGPGLAFWFRPISTAVVEVPLDDRELPFLFRARSADFQELTVQGVITFRVSDPELLARRVDFTIGLRDGRWESAPLEQVAGLLTQLAQQFVIDELVRLDVRRILTDGVAPIRDHIAAGLAGEAALADSGLSVVAVRVAAVTPSADVEKALRQPTRESIQQRADAATFERRAVAVEKERAIAENELQSRIELARRTEGLVAQEGANDRRRAEEAAAAGRIAAQREADAIDLVEAARLRAERERAEIQAAVPPEVLAGLALRELAGQLGQIEHLTVTPDLLTGLLARASGNGGREG